MLTVIVPTYNRLELLRIAVASLLTQKDTLPVALDVLVVDDGSSDGTSDWLSELQRGEPSLRVVRQENGGVTDARNTGLAQLLPQTAFVTFLDSDDASPKGALAAQLAPLLDDQQLELAYGKMLMVDAIDPLSREPAEGARKLDLVGIHLSCAMFRRSLVERIGRFDPEFRQAEDTDYLLRTFEADTRFVQTDTICLYYHRHNGNMTKKQEESRRYFALAIQKSIRRRRADPSIRLVKPSFEVQAIGTAEFF
ncbi:glycosyltransferase family 2 protein [Sedimentimonas flavescens]|uniref:glycosyltransferase family 2 protein n=1 Tax=Sedimentimonas flavescens TaxID=2851012 RepID=UPI001C49CA98|nr:glycosyltransferase family A protein [Sedimentimonas flavescens]MBW0159689.1 glycosyltransferase family 2 protein [Sedimentimonas flavescens]